MKQTKTRSKGPKNSTVENVVGYFKEVNQTLLTLNNTLPPPINLELQRKYKVSWNTIANAKKLKYIETIGNRKSCKYRMLTKIDFEKALKIIELKNKPERESKYKVVSTNPFILNGIYIKPGKKNYKEVRLLNELSTLLVQVFKFDRRYETGYKPARNFKQLLKAVEKYRKVVLMYEEKRTKNKSFQPSLFSLNDIEINVQNLPDFEKTKYRTIPSSELFATEVDDNDEVEIIDPLNNGEPIIRDYMVNNEDADWLNDLEYVEDEEELNNATSKFDNNKLWIVTRFRNFDNLKKGPIEIGSQPCFSDVKYFNTKEQAILYADERARKAHGHNFIVSQITNIVTYEVQVVQKNVDIQKNKN